MSSYPAIDEAIQKKWNINPIKYEPWVNVSDVIRIFDIYKGENHLRSDSALARIMGVKPQTISQMRKKEGTIMAHYAVIYMDALDIDPKLVLVERRYNSSDPRKTISYAQQMFLNIFPNPERQVLMAKWHNEINLLINVLEEAEAEKRAAFYEEYKQRMTALGVS